MPSSTLSLFLANCALRGALRMPLGSAFVTTVVALTIQLAFARSSSAVCGSNDHTTANHSCDGMECDFYSPSHSHTPGTHCEHTKLKCPHCGGEHVVRSPQCKIWERRRNALRKPKHKAAKTGGAPKQVRPKSRAATKDAAKASKEQGADDTTGDEGEAAVAKAKKRKDKGKDKETA